MSEQRRWTLSICGGAAIVIVGDPVDRDAPHERIEVCPVSELDAALERIAALQAALGECHGALSEQVVHDAYEADHISGFCAECDRQWVLEGGEDHGAGCLASPEWLANAKKGGE